MKKELFEVVISRAIILNKCQLDLERSKNRDQVVLTHLSESIEQRSVALDVLKGWHASGHEVVMALHQSEIANAKQCYKQTFQQFSDLTYNSELLAKQLYNSASTIANKVLAVGFKQKVAMEELLHDAHNAFIQAFRSGLEDLCFVDDMELMLEPELEQAFSTPTTATQTPAFFRDIDPSPLGSDAATDIDRFTPAHMIQSPVFLEIAVPHR